MRAMNLLAVASLNPGKHAEFSELFARHNLKVEMFDHFVRNAYHLKDVESHLPGTTYYDNAFVKCKAVFQAAKVPTFADDSGIEVEALNQKPGLHSAHFAKPRANESQDAANRRYLLEQLKGKSNRRARFRCTLVFMVEGVLLKAEGICEGKIAEAEKGNAGFGYDPIFIPDAGNGKTFAELSSEEKNRISHRALAVNELVNLMREREIQLVRP